MKALMVCMVFFALICSMGGNVILSKKNDKLKNLINAQSAVIDSGAHLISLKSETISEKSETISILLDILTIMSVKSQNESAMPHIFEYHSKTNRILI